MAERRAAHRDDEPEETEKEQVEPEEQHAPQSSSDADKEPTKEDATEPDEVADRIIVPNHDKGQQHEVIENLTAPAPRVTRKK